MTLFQRAHDILSAKANKALDAAEKPDEVLDLSYEDMLDQITRIRRGLVDIAASRRRAELQGQQLEHSSEHLQDQAKTALAQGNEALAREALSRNAAVRGQIEDLSAQRDELAEQEQKLEHTLEVMQKRVNDFRSQKEVLKAQYSVAEAQAAPGDPNTGLQRALDQVATMQARAGAVDELIQSGVLEDVGGDTDEIQEELDQAGTDADVDRQLAALKAELGPGAPKPPELTAGAEG
jgi:phage shock protein A